MSDISFMEKRSLEKLFQMSGGYVLNFSDRTFRDFFLDHTHRDIHDDIYCVKGTSKANKLRSFWDIEANYIVGNVIEMMIIYGQEENCLFDEIDLADNCKKIAVCLLQNTPVAELKALTDNIDEGDFETIAQHIRDAIEKNQPEGALDRLHTFVIKYIRSLCKLRGIDVNRSKPLHSIFGEYIKCLSNSGKLESEMTFRILKFNIAILESFNEVRNEKSLAHDNPILNYEESLLIFNNIANLIRFVKSLEARIKNVFVGDGEELFF